MRWENAGGRTSNIEHRTSNIEHRTSNIEHRTSNIRRKSGHKSGQASPLHATFHASTPHSPPTTRRAGRMNPAVRFTEASIHSIPRHDMTPRKIPTDNLDRALMAAGTRRGGLRSAQTMSGPGGRGLPRIMGFPWASADRSPPLLGKNALLGRKN